MKEDRNEEDCQNLSVNDNEKYTSSVKITCIVFIISLIVFCYSLLSLGLFFVIPTGPWHIALISLFIMLCSLFVIALPLFKFILRRAKNRR